MKKAVKTIVKIAVVVAALVLAASLAGGPLAKGYLNRHGEQLTGRRVQAGRVGVNLFTGHLYVRDFTLFEEDGVTPFAGFDTLDLRLHLLQLPFHTVNLRHLTLSGLHATLLQQGERFNFSSLLEHFASDDDHDTTPSPWTLRMRNLRLSHASLLYRDVPGHKELGLDDINLRVPAFAVGRNQQTEGGLTLGFSKGGSLLIDASHDATLGRYSVSLQLDDFDLRNVEDIASEYLDTDRLRGALQARLQADGEMKHLLQSHLGGTVALTGMDMHSGHRQVLAVDTLTADINNINLDARTFDLQRLVLAGLSARYERWDDHNTLADLLKPRNTTDTTGAADSTAPAPKRKAMQLNVGNLAVRRCAFTYIDHTLPDRLELPVTAISLDATNLTTRGANNARLRASLPGGGHLALRWQGMLGDWKQFQDLSLTVKGMDLRQLNPLVVAYTGRAFDDGIMGISSRLRLDHSALDNLNKIDIYKASVGKRRKGVEPRSGVPLKTALYVLKDKDDKIMIELPVKGNVDNPEFSYAKVLWKTLGNLLVKVATSPARAVGNMLGMGGDNLDFIAVGADQHSLASEQYHTLAQLAAVAKEDPLLVVTLERHLPAADSTGRLDRQVRAYWQEQGLDERQLRIVQADSADSQRRTGYAVSSEIMIDD